MSNSARAAAVLCLVIGGSACSTADAEGGWREAHAESPRTPSVGMWGDHDGWSALDEVRVGAAEAVNGTKSEEKGSGSGCPSAKPWTV